MKIAKVRTRFFAFLIDFLINLLFVVIMFYFFGKPTEDGVELNGAPALVTLGVVFIYFVLAELLFGKTVGKYALDIKALSENGEELSFGQAFIRFFFGFFDLFLLVGFFVMYRSGKKQRIGDIVAKTVVIQE